MSPHESSDGKTFASGDHDCRRVGQESYLSEAYRQHKKKKEKVKFTAVSVQWKINSQEV